MFKFAAEPKRWIRVTAHHRTNTHCSTGLKWVQCYRRPRQLSPQIRSGTEKQKNSGCRSVGRVQDQASQSISLNHAPAKGPEGLARSSNGDRGELGRFLVGFHPDRQRFHHACVHHRPGPSSADRQNLHSGALISAVTGYLILRFLKAGRDRR